MRILLFLVYAQGQEGQDDRQDRKPWAMSRMSAPDAAFSLYPGIRVVAQTDSNAADGKLPNLDKADVDNDTQVVWATLEYADNKNALSSLAQ